MHQKQTHPKSRMVFTAVVLSTGVALTMMTDVFLSNSIEMVNNQAKNNNNLHMSLYTYIKLTFRRKSFTKSNITFLHGFDTYIFTYPPTHVVKRISNTNNIYEKYIT